MSTIDPNAAARGGLREARAFGVADNLAIRHAYAMGYLAAWGYPEPERPDIISGYRSPERQRELLERWERGDRQGLTAKPACRSQHTCQNGAQAVDVERLVAGFEDYAYLMTQWGCRDGQSFGDPGHFDLPTNSNPPVDICSPRA